MAEGLKPIKVPFATISRALQGAAAATDASESAIKSALGWASTKYGHEGARVDGVAFAELCAAVSPEPTIRNQSGPSSDVDKHSSPSPPGSSPLVSVAIATAFLLEVGRQGRVADSRDVDQCWALILDAITSGSPAEDVDGDNLRFSSSRSAQGFFSCPLHRILTDSGDIDELLELQVWVPDGQGSNDDSAIHSHQTLMQSWILAGVWTNHLCEVEPELPSRPTFEQLSSSHKRGTTYTVSAGEFHRTEVAPDILHARLCLFGSRRGSIKDASMFGLPQGATSLPQSRDPVVDTPAELARDVDLVRHWEDLLEEANQHFWRAEWEHALRAINGAVALCRQPDMPTTTIETKPSSRGRIERSTSQPSLPIAWHSVRHSSDRGVGDHVEDVGTRYDWLSQYRDIALGKLASANLRLGRSEAACVLLEGVVSRMKLSERRVAFCGELGVAYSRMNRVSDAMRAFQEQYDTAQILGLPYKACRAIGYLGIIKSQLAIRARARSEDITGGGERRSSEFADGREQDGGEDADADALMADAIRDLTERVESARRLLKEAAGAGGGSSHDQTARPRSARPNLLVTWEVVGLARLSHCHQVQGNIDLAIRTALESLDAALTLPDANVAATSRFFLGRALLLAGRRQEALSYFNSRGTTCTPACLLAREPSDENRAFMAELVEAGAEVGGVDDQGYTALDHAVFHGDARMEALVVRGLRKNADAVIARRRAEAHLRRGCRQIFQEHMRAVLGSPRRRRHRSGGPEESPHEILRRLRAVYADALAADESKRALFDTLKYIPWKVFKAFGRLPRSSDGVTRDFSVMDYGAGGGKEGRGGVAIGASSSPPSSSSVSSTKEVSSPPLFLIFFSYRWINKDPAASSPDDAGHTQYRRMMDAVTEFLQRHPQPIDSNVGIWMDFACIDQDDPSKGVAALPMILAQCDAVISLVDDQYHTRAWCSVEALVVQTLRESYGLHLWYEQETASGGLRRALARTISIKDKLLSYEEDRPTVMFLERQTGLLG